MSPARLATSEQRAVPGQSSADASALTTPCIQNGPKRSASIPEINARISRTITASSLIQTVQPLLAWYLCPLSRRQVQKRIIASTYPGCIRRWPSWSPTSLKNQMADVVAGKEVTETAPFAYQLVVNLIPIGGFDGVGYTSEMKMQTGSPQDHVPDCALTAPVFEFQRCALTLSPSLLRFERPLSPDEARAILEDAPEISYRQASRTGTQCLLLLRPGPYLCWSYSRIFLLIRT